MTTYEKIYRALKDKNARKFNVGNQVFLIELEDLSRGYRYNLYRWYISGYKVYLSDVTIRNNALPPDYKKVIRIFLQKIFYSCLLFKTQSLDRYTKRSIRKANNIYHWRNKWDRDYNVIETYDTKGVFIGWREKTYLTW